MSRVINFAKDVRELLEDLDLYRLPVVPTKVCERLGIDYIETPYNGIEGTLLVKGSHQLIGVNSRIPEPSRKTFTCAHELGHYYYDLGSQGEMSFTCSSSDVEGLSQKDVRELRANQFAAELLMPEALFKPLIQSETPSWSLISRLAEMCGTSMQATAHRYVELGPHGCWLAILRDNGRVHRYEKSYRVGGAISTLRPILLPHQRESNWQTVPAKIWLGERRWTRNRKLYQAFLPRNRYGETLALLWDRHRDFEQFEFSLNGLKRRLEKWFFLT